MMKIVKDTNPRLREKSLPVELPLSKENEALIHEMMDYLLLSQDASFCEKHPSVREGVGLAAPQVGHNVRMLVISYPNPTEEDPKAVVQHALCNPKIVASSLKKAYLEGGEGCLSVDEEHPGYVYRDFKVVVDAYDAFLKQNVRITARGYEAVVLQHEMDHLDGILFYDHIDKRDPFRKLPNSVAV